MGKRNNRRTQLTKKLMRDALLELMQEKPFAQITVKDICTTADLNRTTFYLHYPNLDELLQGVEQSAYAEVEDYIRSIRANNDKVEQIASLLTYIQNNLPLFQILLLSTTGDYKERLMSHFLLVLKPQEPASPNPEEETLAWSFIVNGSIGLISGWIKSDFRMSAKELAQLMYNLCHGAYQARPGTPRKKS